MAPKIRGSINDATKSKACIAAEAKKKVVKEEKKMSSLQQWPKHWGKLREWGKSENARNLTVTRIKSYLNAPIIDNFGNLKEEAAKFLVSRYHDGNILLDQPIAITRKLINFITSLPLNGEIVPISSENPSLL